MRWKILVSLLSFVGVIIVVLWLFQVFFLEKFYIMIKSKSVKNASSQIIEVVNESDYQEQIKAIASENEFCVIVYEGMSNASANPIEIFNSNKADPRCRINSNIKEIKELQAEAIENGGKASKLLEKSNIDTYRVQFPTTMKESLPNTSIKNNEDIENEMVSKSKKELEMDKKTLQNMTYITVVKGENNTLKTVVVNAQLTPVNATINTIKIQFVIIAIILLLIAMYLAFYLSKKIAIPIMQINKSAKILGTGEYDVTFEGEGYLEIQELTDTLNYAAKELSKVEGLRRELIANMSHDLRTPLTMISGYSEVMRDIPGENTADNIQIIIDETNRLTSLVNDMLDLSKIQAGVQKLNKSTFSITKEIKAIIQRYEKLLGNDAYKIQFIYEKDAVVKGDAIKVNQVIYNLINNAITYCGEDRTVIVELKVAGDYVLIQISDHGPGIEENQLPYIWERYYKVDKNHLRSMVGTGLGLSIVKAILILHKVEYGVRSEINKGTTFWFQLPIEEE